MKTYPIKRLDGSLHAFEFSNAWISLWTIRRILRSVDGVSSVRRKFFSADRLVFDYCGVTWAVGKPWGAKERYWIGPENLDSPSTNVHQLHHAFLNYRSGALRLVDFVSERIG